MLPFIFLSEDTVEDLSAYIHTYLIEEISAEGAVRNLASFSRFLQAAELKTWIDYTSPDRQLRYWRSKSGFEVDSVIDDELALEVKAAAHITQKHIMQL